MNSIEMGRLCLGCMQPKASAEAVCPHCGYAGEKNLPHQLAAGSVLDGRYLIGRVLGQGGFGITYVAMDLNLQTRVAIKEYYPEGLVSRGGTGRGTVYAHTGQGETLYAKGREQFLQEAQVLAQFQYLPGIVTVRDYFNANHTAYIVMEYIEGVTLKKSIVQAGGRLPSAPLLAQLEPLMESLEIVHSMNLLHRDISPDNIMVRPDGSFVLLDFGAARQFSVEGEHSNTVNVKHGYAPPEQYTTRGNQGPWTDVYALCATIYKATTGQTPPQSVDRVTGTVDLVPPRALGADFTPHQEAVLLQGMAMSSTERIASIKELRQALDAKKPQPKRTAKATSKPKQKAAAKPSGKKAWIGIAAGALLLLGAGILFIRPNTGSIIQATTAQESLPAANAPIPEPEKSAKPAKGGAWIREALKNMTAGETEDGYAYAPYEELGVAITGYNGRETKLTLPQEIEGVPVVRIENDAFGGNLEMLSVTVPEGVLTIGDNSFYKCPALRFVSLPVGLTSIGESAFYNCIELKSVSLPDGLTYIGDFAFSDCIALEEIRLPDSLTDIGAYAFRDCIFQTVELPEGIERINDSAFAYCQRLTSVQLPGSLKNIGRAAFLGCYGLQSIALPSGLETIGAEAFRGCSELRGPIPSSIGIPPSVKSIGEAAFATKKWDTPITIFCDSGSYAIQYAMESDLEYQTPYSAR